jgi:hypothetical protein
MCVVTGRRLFVGDACRRRAERRRRGLVTVRGVTGDRLVTVWFTSEILARLCR